MENENTLKYIIPTIIKFQNVDDLLENNRHRSLFDMEKTLS